MLDNVMRIAWIVPLAVGLVPGCLCSKEDTRAKTVTVVAPDGGKPVEKLPALPFSKLGSAPPKTAPPPR
jgi:hypothetical protein